MTDGANAPRPLLPALLLAALVLPFDPGWLDFEAARRAMLLAMLGALLLVRPRWFLVRGSADTLLASIFAWTCAATLLGSGEVVAVDAGLRLSWWAALWAIVRLANATGRDGAVKAAPWLLATAALVGCAQRCGLEIAGGTALEPTSLFGNRNVAAEFTAIAASVVVANFSARPRLHAVCLALAGAYAVVNGSRSALVVLPVVAGLAAVLPPRRGRAGFVPLLALSLGAGLALAALSALPRPSLGAPLLPGAATGTATLEVRLEIQKGALGMVAGAPLLGVGAGQFAVQYPRHRSQREIELSSLQRNEPRRVATVHDDWLETAVEGGVPAFLLLLLFAIARLRQAEPRAQALPLVALFLLMLVRAPLGNAPAVAMALFATGPSARGTASPSKSSAWFACALGLCLLGLGLLGATSAFALARYATERGDAPTGDRTWIERATSLAPVDATAFELLARERQIAATSSADVEQALAAADRAIALRPFEPSYLLLRADLLRAAARFDEAKQQLAQVAALDPGHPQVQVQLAAVYFTEGDVDGAIAALCTDPPPSLREALAARLDEFAQLAKARGSDADHARFAAEAAFVRVLDALAKNGALADALAKERFDRLREAIQRAGGKDRDVRELLLLAVLALRVDDRATAATAGELAQKKGLPLLRWQWSLAAPFAEGLRALPAWAAVLPPR